MRVGQMVRQLVWGCSDIVHLKRLAAVVRVAEGIVRAQRLMPSRVGRSLAGPTFGKHGIKCVDRLLRNRQLAKERPHFFRALARRLLGGWARPVILVDWTEVMGGHEALVAAVPIGGRAIPIYLEVHPLKKLGNTTVEERFLSCLSKVVCWACRPIIVSDAGFKGPFFEAVCALGWDFLGRVRGTAKAVPADGGEAISKEEFYARASITAKDLGSFHLFVDRGIPCRLVVVRKRRKPGPKPAPPACKEEREFRQSALDPWLLATSLSDGDAAHIVGLYAKRMQIEECFRDAKNHRFGWSLRDVSTAHANRAANLLLLAVIAMVIVTLIGLSGEMRGRHRIYQASSVRTERVLSLFVLACAMLRREDEPLPSPIEYRATLGFLRAVLHA